VGKSSELQKFFRQEDFYLRKNPGLWGWLDEEKARSAAFLQVADHLRWVEDQRAFFNSSAYQRIAIG
jgi:hypothetical protein